MLPERSLIQKKMKHSIKALSNMFIE